jgi:hypothetical protein
MFILRLISITLLANRVLTPIEKFILEKMFRHGYIGGKHTSEGNIPKGLPKNAHGDARKALKNLIRQGYVIPKTTCYGLQVSLNSTRISEIKQILEA